MLQGCGTSRRKKPEEGRNPTADNPIAQLQRGAVSSASALFILVLITFATPSNALGYGDPGTGAFVYQAVYAGFLAGIFYLRKILNHFWGKQKK
jgi:hypothetical protein